jgi:hypothetical protein
MAELKNDLGSLNNFGLVGANSHASLLLYLFPWLVSKVVAVFDDGRVGERFHKWVVQQKAEAMSMTLSVILYSSPKHEANMYRELKSHSAKHWRIYDF